MSLEKLIETLEDDIKTIVSSEFTVTINDTTTVPTIDSQNITYPNLDAKIIKAKRIETCVLFIDMRKSTELNLQHKPETLTKLYAAFMRGMVKAAQHFNGKVRNIIGDRVMVVFDTKEAVKDAINTAMVLNSVGIYIIDKHFKHNEISFGIGVDYGKMLVSKGGIIKNGSENAPYKSLVWLGRPANVASKLTDLANKEVEVKKFVEEDYIIRITKVQTDFKYEKISFNNYIKELFEAKEEHRVFDKISDNRFVSGVYNPAVGNGVWFITHTEKVEKTDTVKTANILVTKEVYDRMIKDYSDHTSFQNNLWKPADTLIYPGHHVYGLSAIFIAFRDR